MSCVSLVDVGLDVVNCTKWTKVLQNAQAAFFAGKLRITLRSLSADGRRELRDVSRRPYVKQEVLVSRPEVVFGHGK